MTIEVDDGCLEIRRYYHRRLVKPSGYSSDTTTVEPFPLPKLDKRRPTSRKKPAGRAGFSFALTSLEQFTFLPTALRRPHQIRYDRLILTARKASV
jgi:hypothetical protein